MVLFTLPQLTHIIITTNNNNNFTTKQKYYTTSKNNHCFYVVHTHRTWEMRALVGWLVGLFFGSLTRVYEKYQIGFFGWVAGLLFRLLYCTVRLKDVIHMNCCHISIIIIHNIVPWFVLFVFKLFNMIKEKII